MNILIWAIILLGILGLVFIAKLSHLKHKLSVSLYVILGLFLIITFLKVADANSIELNTFGGFFSALKLYFFWIGHVFDNMRTITGNAIRMDWFSAN